MKKILRYLRKIRLINFIIRGLIKKTDNLKLYWPVSGIIDCEFDEITFKLYSKCDDHQVNFFYYKLPFHETKIIRTMVAFARKSKCIVDIGANTGIHSIICGKSNSNIKIYSIEPYRPNYIRLSKNKKINKCSNIEIITSAIGDSQEQLKMYVPVGDELTDVSSGVDGHGKKIYPEVKWKEIFVEQITFDILSNITGKIDFFKCDVEGLEAQVLKGGSRFFESNRPPFIIEITLDDEKCEYFNHFAKEFEYNIYYIGEDGFTKLDLLYNFASWPNFLFTQYKHPQIFIPFSELEDFVARC